MLGLDPRLEKKIVACAALCSIAIAYACLILTEGGTTLSNVTTGAEFAGSVQMGVYGWAFAMAGPELYMQPPKVEFGRMWRRAVKFGRRVVPSHWLESADLTEYWRKMFERSASLKRLHARP